MISLSNLTYYPIKACRGFDVKESHVQRMGLVNDRRMMVVTPEVSSSHNENIHNWH